MATTRMTIEEGHERAKQAGAEPSPEQRPLLGPELLQRSGRVIDLTRPIFEGMPMWFGHQKTYVMVNQDIPTFKKLWNTNNGFYARSMIISEHCGTHTDATIEYDEQGQSLTETPLEYYWGSAVCLDLSHVKLDPNDPEHTGYAFADDIKVAEEKLAANGEEIRRGDIVLGWFDYGDRHFPEKVFIDQFPGYSWEAAEYLAQKGIVNLGTDCAGIDQSHDPEFSAHQVCRKYGLVNTENIGYLGQLASTRFQFFGLPLNIKDGTGSPIRAFAWVPED